MRPAIAVQDCRDAHRKKLLRAGEYLEMVRDRAESVGVEPNLLLFPDHIYDFVVNTADYPKLDQDLRATHSIGCLLGLAEGMEMLPLELMRAAVTVGLAEGLPPIIRHEHPLGRFDATVVYPS